MGYFGSSHGIIYFHNRIAPIRIHHFQRPILHLHNLEALTRQQYGTLLTILAILSIGSHHITGNFPLMVLTVALSRLAPQVFFPGSHPAEIGCRHLLCLTAIEHIVIESSCAQW